MKLKTLEVLVLALFAASSWEVGWAINNELDEYHNVPKKEVRKLQQLVYGTSVCSQRLDPRHGYCMSSIACSVLCKIGGPTFGGECRAGNHIAKKCYCNLPCGILNAPSAPVNPVPVGPVNPAPVAPAIPAPSAPVNPTPRPPVKHSPRPPVDPPSDLTDPPPDDNDYPPGAADMGSDYGPEGDEPVEKKNKKKKKVTE